MNTTIARIILSCALLAVATGCAAKNTEATSAGARENARSQPAPTPPARTAPAEVAQTDDDRPEVSPIYYELDSAQLKDESRQMLQRLAEYLRRHPSAAVEVDGHTCDLGTSEYNIALGMKRANAARDYLVKLGVSESRVGTVSFGEEKPAEHGEEEHARSKNRRSEFSVRLAQASNGR